MSVAIVLGPGWSSADAGIVEAIKASLRDDGYRFDVNADGTALVERSASPATAVPSSSRTAAEERWLKAIFDRIQQIALAYPDPEDKLMTHAKLIEVIESIDPRQESIWLQRFRQSLLEDAGCAASAIGTPIRAHILAVRRNPNSAAVLRAHLQGRLFGAGQYSPTRLDQLEATLNDAIDAVPSVVERLLQAADQARITHLIEPMLAHAISYFLRTDDLVSDHLGALGLLDDAYLLHAFLVRINDAYHHHTGVWLLAEDLTATVRVLRWVLGPEIVSHLDHAVTQEVNRAVQQPFYHELAQRRQTLSAAILAGGAGGRWQDEMSKLSTQLGGSV